MTDRTPRDILPFMTPQWLLDATKKPPRPPSQALLDRMRYAREHPDELAKELRESSARAGRDADALFKTMAKMRQNVHRARLAQRSKNIHSSIEAQDLVVADESVDTVGAETGIARVAAFRPAAVVPSTSSVPRGLSAEAQAMVVSEDTPRLASPSASVQRRMGTRGQITKPTRSQSRSERDLSSDKARRKPPNSGTTSGATSSASGTASPIVVGSTQTPSSSSVAGAVIKALNATSDSLDNQSPAITQPILQSYPFPIRSAMPNWYASVSQQSQMRLERRRPQEIAAIDALKACISRCEQGQHLDKLDKEYNDLRDHVHKAETKLVMDKAKAKKTRILLQNGLPRIFDEHAKFPWDLKADSWHLYEKWMNGDFDNDILRGIITVKGKDRNGDRLDPTYRKEHPKDTKIFGNNGAILGQWWPSQLCAVRDGVHGAAQGGIYGDKDGGTYSIVLSSGGYHDRDDGDIIEYSGTEGSNFEMKAATQSMITSSKLGNQIRVLRSSQLPKSNKHRPSCGLRYDGLYQIKSYEGIDSEKQTYRFHLERIPGQEPIRSQGVTRRPTVFEEEAYERCKGRI